MFILMEVLLEDMLLKWLGGVSLEHIIIGSEPILGELAGAFKDFSGLLSGNVELIVVQLVEHLHFK